MMYYLILCAAFIFGFCLSTMLDGFAKPAKYMDVEDETRL